jgi:hypothetical protein
MSQLKYTVNEHQNGHNSFIGRSELTALIEAYPVFWITLINAGELYGWQTYKHSLE